MLEIYFAAPKTLARLRAGPSGAYLDGFAASLERDGYRGATAVRYLRGGSPWPFSAGRRRSIDRRRLIGVLCASADLPLSAVEGRKAQPPHILRRQALSRLPCTNWRLSIQRISKQNCRSGTRCWIRTVAAEASRRCKDRPSGSILVVPMT
jgi:hypothetical protein